MKVDSTPNNIHWHEQANLYAAKTSYRHPELNDFELESLSPDTPWSKKQVTGYSDGDTGSSLQEVKNEGNIGLANRKSVSKAVTIAGVAAIVAVSVYSLITGSVPSMGEVSIETTESSISYSFSASCSYESTLYVSLKEREDLEAKSYKFTSFGVEENLAVTGTFDSLTLGSYTILVTSTSLIGTSNLYSQVITLQ